MHAYGQPRPQSMRRCLICAISYPPGHDPTCDGCGGPLDDLEGAYDADWQEMADDARRRRDAAEVVLAHRRLLLVEAGVSEAEAELLADLPDVDVHSVIDAIKSGCPPDTAVKIWS